MTAPYSEIILVMLAITLAFIVAYWLISTQSMTTHVELLELINKKINEEETYYTFTIIVENRGTIETTIDHIMINRSPPEKYDAIIHPFIPKLKPGEKTTVTIQIPKSYFNHGQSVEFLFITARGFEFPILIYIP